jgi:hypothetical protein
VQTFNRAQTTKDTKETKVRHTKAFPSVSLVSSVAKTILGLKNLPGCYTEPAAIPE